MLEAALTIEGATSAEAARKESSIVGEVLRVRDVWEDKVGDELLENLERGQVDIYTLPSGSLRLTGKQRTRLKQTLVAKNPPT